MKTYLFKSNKKKDDPDIYEVLLLSYEDTSRETVFDKLSTYIKNKMKSIILIISKSKHYISFFQI